MGNVFFPDLDELPLPFRVIAVGNNEEERYIARQGVFLGSHLMLSRKNCGMLEINDATYMLEEGMVFYIETGRDHAYYPAKDKWNTCWIVFSDPKGILNALLPPKMPPQKIDPALYEKHHHEILSYAATPGVASAYAASASLYNLIISLATINPAGKGESKTQKKLDALLLFIAQNYGSDLGLSELAACAGISEQYLCRIFKNELDISPYEYLIRYRIKKAKELMCDKHIPIHKISGLTGFKDVSYFCHVFSRYEGLSPQKYREAFYHPKK